MSIPISISFQISLPFILEISIKIYYWPTKTNAQKAIWKMRKCLPNILRTPYTKYKLLMGQFHLALMTFIIWK